jgi:hypothetical protein
MQSATWFVADLHLSYQSKMLCRQNLPLRAAQVNTFVNPDVTSRQTQGFLHLRRMVPPFFCLS